MSPTRFWLARVSVALRKQDAATRTLLGKGILTAYKNGYSNFEVFLEHLNNLRNVRDLVKEEMFPMYAVRTPQAFKFAQDPADGDVKMQVQARSYNEDWGVINRNGEYGPGWMTLMKSWPDLRDIPDHPRKVIPDHTLHQHRVSIEASGPRIRNSCRNVGVLPEGATAEGLYASRMQELAESVVDLPTPPGMRESVSVGKVLAVEQGDGGEELELH